MLISTSQTSEENFKEVRRGIQSTAAEIGEIRDGVTSIQQQANTIQASTSSISSTLVTGLEIMQSCQHYYLSKLEERTEVLPELIENLLDRKIDGLLLNSQRIRVHHTVAMQNSVGGIIFGVPNANLGQGSIIPDEIDWKTKSSASRL